MTHSLEILLSFTLHILLFFSSFFSSTPRTMKIHVRGRKNFCSHFEWGKKKTTYERYLFSICILCVMCSILFFYPAALRQSVLIALKKQIFKDFLPTWIANWSEVPFDCWKQIELNVAFCSRLGRLDPAVLIEGVLFRARYLGSTQLVCEGQPTKSTRMMQAEEAVSRIKVSRQSPALYFCFRF